MKTIILNSKLADKHLNMVRAQHAAILEGINNQSIKVQNIKAEQELKDKEQNEMKMTNDREVLEQENKRKELEIKAQALTM